MLKLGFLHLSIIPKRSIFVSKRSQYCFSNFFSQLYLNPYLQANLKENHIATPTNIQQKSLRSLLDGQNGVVAAESGSGKSLCYILPLMNEILNRKLDMDKELYRSQSPRGGIVLVPTKELAAQVYRQIRQLDLKSKLSITRTGSLAYLAPIIHIMSDEANAKDPQIQKKLGSLAYESVIRGVSWKEFDILVTTPSQLEQMLNVKDSATPNDNIDPKVVVLDEFDLLTSESAIMKSTLNILNRFGCGSRLSLSKRQFIFSGSALPPNYSSAFSFLSQDFSKFAQTFQSPDLYKFNPSTTHEIIQTSQYLDKHRDMSIQDILAKVINDSKSKKIIVFVNQPPAAIQLAQYLNSVNITATPFHAKLSTEMRMKALSDFDQGKARILVSTDLGSRGLDFEDVDHVIQFDFAEEALTFLQRSGRTSRRQGQQGIVTSFVRNNEIDFAEDIQLLIQKDKEISPKMVNQEIKIARNKDKMKDNDESD